MQRHTDVQSIHLESSHCRDRDQWLGLALSFALSIFSSWLRYLLLAQVQCKTLYCICTRTWCLSALKGALGACLRGEKIASCAWPCGHLEAELLTLGKQAFTAFCLCCLEWALTSLRASQFNCLHPVRLHLRVHRGSEGALDERPWLISGASQGGVGRTGGEQMHFVSETFDSFQVKHDISQCYFSIFSTQLCIEIPYWWCYCVMFVTLGQEDTKEIFLLGAASWSVCKVRDAAKHSLKQF